MGSDYWFDQDYVEQIYIDIYNTLRNGTFEAEEVSRFLLSGIIDSSTYHPLRRVVTIHGRDKISELSSIEMGGFTFLNMTAGEVISQLAEKIGLKAKVDPTQGLVGQFYQYEHKSYGLSGMHRHRTAWDFCVEMQRYYGYDMWVESGVLHFQSPGNMENEAIRLSFSSSGNVQGHDQFMFSDAAMTRRYGMDASVQVAVSSWDTKQRCSHGALYPPSPFSGTKKYNISLPAGKTQDQCETIAYQKYSEITAHALAISAEVHPALDISPRQLVVIDGTGTGFDGQTYVVDDVSLSISTSVRKQTVTLRKRIL